MFGIAGTFEVLTLFCKSLTSKVNSMFETLFLIFVGLYFIQSVIFMIGASKKFPQISEPNFPIVSVIVAARNEEENIHRCLVSLDKQIYPDGKLEIIIVDDHSNDSTGKIIDEFIAGKNRFKKIVTNKQIGHLKGKTNALANAIEISKGEVILTTDADCEASPEWVYTTASYYQKECWNSKRFYNTGSKKFVWRNAGARFYLSSYCCIRDD